MLVVALARPSALPHLDRSISNEVHICKFIKCGWSSAVTGAFRIEILSGARSGCQCVVEARSENRIGVLALTVPVRWSMHGSIDRVAEPRTPSAPYIQNYRKILHRTFALSWVDAFPPLHTTSNQESPAAPERRKGTLVKTPVLSRIPKDCAEGETSNLQQIPDCKRINTCQGIF